MSDMGEARDAFLREALWHGPLDGAARILAAHPGLAGSDLQVAAVLGDDAAVRRFIAGDPSSVHVRSAPHGGDALTYLGLSRYLRLDASRTPAFVRAATALLDAGADPNGGFWTAGPNREYESALYGAAGVAHEPEVTRLLLERGADPNDGEVVYHAPETSDHRVLELLVGTGRLTAESLGVMLIRKIDWHDQDGLRFLLDHGAPADGERGRGWLSLHHALARGNALRSLELLLDHGADPQAESGGLTAIARAAREGRSDVLGEFARRGIAVELDGADGLAAACASDDGARIGELATAYPAARREVISMGGALLARFTSNGNLTGVRRLLDLGVSAAAPFEQGDGYFGIPKGSLPVHVAAWRAQPAIVRLLIERGSPVDVADANGATPLMLAVRACVDSFWTERRSPESVAALLAAGASARGVALPTGYGDVDRLLQERRARP